MPLRLGNGNGTALTPLRVFALIAVIAAGAWAAWRSPMGEEWRWRRALAAEHAAGEAILATIALPEGSGGEPAGGRIVVAIGERLTMDETGWALAHDWAGGPLNYGPLLLDFALVDDALWSTVDPMEKELRRIEWLWHLDRYEDRTVEIHAGGGVPFREVRRVLWTVDTAAWRAWFRVIGEDGVAALPYSFDEVRDLKRSEWEPDPPALVVHLRSSGMWVVHKKSVGLEVPKIDHKQDFLALKELMTRDRELFPGDTIAVLNTDDDVPYSEMIAAFQLARAHGYRIALAGGPPSLTSDTPVSTPPGFDASNATALGDSPSVTGALPRADIEAVVKRNMNQLRYCYQRELVKSPKLAGEIKVKFVITKDGSVSSATTKSSTMNSPAVESCLNGRFLRFTFPPPQGGGIVIVQYPFTFSRE